MKNYTIIDNQILEKDDELEPMEKLLLIYLLKYNNAEKGYAFPSMKTLSKHLGYSHDRYTRKIINSLEEKGYIKKETVKQKNRYYIIGEVQNVPNIDRVQNVPIGEVQNVPIGEVQNVPTKSTNKNTNKITIDDDERTPAGNLLEVINSYKKILGKYSLKENEETMLKEYASKMDLDLLKEVFTKASGKNVASKYSWIKTVLKDYADRNIFTLKAYEESKKKNKSYAPKKKTEGQITAPKTRFHNINESFRKYDPDELEELLKESQKGKF